MRKNIKEELEEKYLRAVLVNDENLLIYTDNEYKENRVDIKVRYVDKNKIIEQYISSLTKEEFLTKREKLVEINEAHTAIAIYKERDKNLVLDRLYMLDTHDFDIPDFVDIEYKMYFPENTISETLVKKRGSKNGKY